MWRNRRRPIAPCLYQIVHFGPAIRGYRSSSIMSFEADGRAKDRPTLIPAVPARFSIAVRNGGRFIEISFHDCRGSDTPLSCADTKDVDYGRNRSVFRERSTDGRKYVS